MNRDEQVFHKIHKIRKNRGASSLSSPSCRLIRKMYSSLCRRMSHMMAGIRCHHKIRRMCKIDKDRKQEHKEQNRRIRKNRGASLLLQCLMPARQQRESEPDRETCFS